MNSKVDYIVYQLKSPFHTLVIISRSNKIFYQTRFLTSYPKKRLTKKLIIILLIIPTYTKINLVFRNGDLKFKDMYPKIFNPDLNILDRYRLIQEIEQAEIIGYVEL